MSSLAQVLAHISRTWPPALVRDVAAQFVAGRTVHQIERNIVSTSAREGLRALKDALDTSPTIDGAGIGLALLSALENYGWHEKNKPELVWTGPATAGGPWRRTDAALLEVIQSAESSLWLVTFAVHGGQILARSLQEAANRGVEIKVVCESNTSGKIRGNNLERLRAIMPASTQIFEWPAERRGRNDNGDFGTLHAKIALADRKLALLSSANLTDCALDSNIESGILLRGDAAAQIARQLENLVKDGIWKEC